MAITATRLGRQRSSSVDNPQLRPSGIFSQRPTSTVFGNPAAPYINSLVTPGNPNAAQVSYASNYQNAGVGIHPSEPNYIWAEAGSNLGVLNDNDPFQSPGGTNQTTPNSLSNYLQLSGHTWRSYQEDATST